MNLRKLKRWAVTAAAGLSLAASAFGAADTGVDLSGATSEGGPGCHDAEVFSGKLITGICWECVFPIIVGKLPISTEGAGRVPPGAADTKLLGLYFSR